MIANCCPIILKRIVPDEYYLFSSDGYALAVGRRGIIDVAADDV